MANINWLPNNDDQKNQYAEIAKVADTTFSDDDDDDTDYSNSSNETNSSSTNYLISTDDESSQLNHNLGYSFDENQPFSDDNNDYYGESSTDDNIQHHPVDSIFEHDIYLENKNDIIDDETDINMTNINEQKLNETKNNNNIGTLLLHYLHHFLYPKKLVKDYLYPLFKIKDTDYVNLYKVTKCSEAYLLYKKQETKRLNNEQWLKYVLTITPVWYNMNKIALINWLNESNRYQSRKLSKTFLKNNVLRIAKLLKIEKTTEPFITIFLNHSILI